MTLDLSQLLASLLGAVDWNTLVNGIMAIANGNIAVAVVQWLKHVLKIDGGPKALILTAVETGAITALFLLYVTHAFTIWTFVICWAIAFGKASGKYTIEVKAKATAPTA